MTRHALRSTAILILAAVATATGTAAAQDRDFAAPPAKPVKLVFIHHSTGEGWLADWGGRLGAALKAKKYFVSDTNYGWGPDGIGDRTDTGHWWLWFRGPKRTTYLNALYKEYEQHCDYTRLAADPGGENTIVMFKSCFPNSHIGGKPNDPPKTGANPLRGQDCGSAYMKVANVKGIYKDLLVYFKSRPDKMFILISSPPLVKGATDAAHAANARAVHNWLVKDWLKGYPHKNVAVFDFYNVLTSNGGNRNKNDVGQTAGNHHRFRNGIIQHIQTVASNYCAYGASGDDSHPTAAGGKKASAEFASLINVWYNAWQASLQKR
ncbi:MAG: hypothetical protein JW742_09210 [Candidatus Aminicenantes bacterium]|nr:hypothetical protein [Candidatus Aminicenantes bacterium]